MKIDIILLNSVFLVGTGIVIGILGMMLMLNKKVDRLSSEVSRINYNIDNLNWNSTDDFFEDRDINNSFNIAKVKNSVKESNAVKESNIVKENNTVNFMTYKNEAELQIAAISEDSASHQKVKTNQTIGIVFCRNCASQFTSDKEACPICGARRH